MTKEQAKQLRALEEGLKKLEKLFEEGLDTIAAMRSHLVALWQAELPLTDRPEELPKGQERII